MSSQPGKASPTDREREWTAQDRLALDDLFNQLYDKIRLLAARVRWNSSNPTLNPTALVHEAYMKLRKDPSGLALKSYDEVIAMFANAMRQILIDGARRKAARKRSTADLPERPDLPIEDAIALDTALDELERENRVQAKIVQCRFLLGMTVEETAIALNIAKRTVEREWHEARERLSQKM